MLLKIMSLHLQKCFIRSAPQSSEYTYVNPYETLLYTNARKFTSEIGISVYSSILLVPCPDNHIVIYNP